MNSSLFLRLYLSITAVIIASIFLVTLALDFYSEESSEADFVTDISIIAFHLDELAPFEATAKAEILQQMSGFDIQFLDAEQRRRFINNHEKIDEIDGFEVFEIDQFRLAGLKDNLVVMDSDKLTPAQQIRENFEFLLLMSFIFVAIAMVLYLSVRRISAQVNRLSQASHAIAEGELNTRVDEAMPAPLHQMAKSFNHMAQSLQHAQLQQQTMANAIAHELRTPLTRIQLALGILHEQQHDEFTNQLHQDINRYAVEMEALANDTLTLQRLDYDNNPVVQDCRLDELIRERQQEMLRVYPERIIELDLCQATIQGNPRHLQLIIDNLASNACKYADRKVCISLSESRNQLCLKVGDDGEGISQELRQQILQPFTRLDNSRSRQTGGFGLGLAIVSTVVKKMDATLEISDSSLGGAEFIITFKVPASL